VPVTWKREGGWTTLQLPSAPSDQPASVVKISLDGPAHVDPTPGVLPNLPLSLPVEFAEVAGATKRRIGWMEKFGEWKHASQVSKWTEEGRASWTVEVAEAGDYRVDLVYRGEGRLGWSVETDDGGFVQNQQAATAVYHRYPLGLLTFAKPGRHTLTAKLVGGKRMSASLQTLILSPVK
jgi:alpha-L-fucosidase